MHRSWDNWLWKMLWPWNPGQRSLKVFGSETYQSATYDFLLTFHSNHGHILYRFGDKRRLQSNIPPPCIWCPIEGVPLRIGYRRMVSKKLEWWGYRTEEVWQYLQRCGYNASTWQTDGQTHDNRKDRANAQHRAGKNPQSSSQIITINKPISNFLQAGCPSCHPTISVKALKENITFHGLAYPKLIWGSFDFVSDH